MSFKVFSDTDLPEDKWAALTGDSFFSSPSFISLWRNRGGEPVYYVDLENNNIAAGIAGVLTGRFPVRRYDSMPDGFPGGPYFSADCDEVNRRRFMAAFEERIKAKRVIRASINDSSSVFDSSLFRKQELSAHVLELTEDKYIPPRREVQKHIRGSKERGGRIEIFDDENDLERFYELGRKTKKRHGQSMVYPLEFFRRLFQISRGSTSILWLKVMLEDKMIGSQISFFDNGRAFNWQFYYDKKYSYYKPGYLLLDYAINYAIENGVRRFSMGSTPGNLVSLVKYKERWGGSEVGISQYQYLNGLGKILYGWRNR